MQIKSLKRVRSIIEVLNGDFMSSRACNIHVTCYIHTLLLMLKKF